MAVYKRGETWWYKFIFGGKLVRESTKSTRKTVAIEAERNRRLELERIYAGMPHEKRENRIKTVTDVVRPYLEHYGSNHREQSQTFAEARLNHILRLLGATLLPDLSEDRIRNYIKVRLDEGVCGRTINMELGELSRAIGRKWSVLWPRVRKLEEKKDAGRALSPDEESRLLEAAGFARSPILTTFLRVGFLTGMRSGEITGLTWAQVDLERRVITVGRAKTSNGTGRQIPMNRELALVLAAHRDWFVSRFEAVRPEWFLFPFGRPTPSDPSRPTTTMKTAWTSLRKRANVDCRLHDLRHTAATKMAEAGVPESTMLSLMGHMSRAMMERYSHIRMVAKREAVESLSTPKPQTTLASDREGTIPYTNVSSGSVQ
jgi:integrase